ncbi:MAG: putative bifunctional diguanylate cyclase/phosphodiesterase, partial [Acidiferrobacteraceae bacterium]
GTTEIEGRRRDGSTVFIEISLSPMAMSGAPRFIAIARDISERRRMSEVAHHQAYYDALIGLPNLALLQERIKELSLASASSRSSFSLMVIELERLRDINNTLGHPTGDCLLQEVGATLQGVLTDSELAAYLGAGTFAVVSPDTDKSGVSGIARRILDVLTLPFVLGHLTLDVGATAGIALFPEHGQECARLLQRAAIALQETRRIGGGYQLYEEEKDPYTPRRLALMGDLHQTIERNELFVVYQPKISLRTGAVVGVEALVRWKHPEFGLIAPDEFIPIAEQTGFIKRLTLWVLHTALHQCAVWKAGGLDLAVAVNISARTLQDTQLPTQVAAEISGSGLTAASLEFEITESTIMADPVRAMDLLTQFRRMGVRLSIDDFGTGYSSLGYLKRLPVDAVKIDKSFVLGMTNDEDDAVIVRSIIDVAHTLGLQVVAEGIENQESVYSLVGLGCDEAQGYYVHRPVVPEQIEAWIQLGHGDHTRSLQKLRSQVRDARTGQKSG